VFEDRVALLCQLDAAAAGVAHANSSGSEFICWFRKRPGLLELSFVDIAQVLVIVIQVIVVLAVLVLVF
jgi:hypothetical protein